MKRLGMTIRYVLEVDDEMADSFKDEPTGGLLLIGAQGNGSVGIGDDQTTIGLSDEEPVKPVGMRVTFEDLGDDWKRAFLGL